MPEGLFENFIKEYDASYELCNKYDAILPSDLIALWKKYGFGSFMGGYKDGLFKGMASGFDFFLEDLQNEVFNEDYFDIFMYTEAIRTWGNIKFDECFGYVPLLGLGGSEKVQNLKKVKIKEHIEIISQLVGKIGMR